MVKRNNKQPSTANRRKSIIFTGGGSAGHVVPNLVLIDKCLSEDWVVNYIGSKDGIEKKLIQQRKIPYHSVATGKLRRYFSWRNFLDPFKVVYGMMQSVYLIRKSKPDVVFSKGGFVAFPVVFAAWLNRVPVVAHESDLMPGLANRLGFPFASQICLTFEGAKKYFKRSPKLVVTGTPIREALFCGDGAKAKKLCQFENDKPVLLIVGGGLGSERINQVVRASLPKLLDKYNIIHLCGEGKVDKNFETVAGYKQFDYADDSYPDLIACADVVVSRAGANTVYELLALKKPHIFVPLSKQASNGHQISNAKHFANMGLSYVIAEGELTSHGLDETIGQLQQNRKQVQQKLNQYAVVSGTSKIYQVLFNAVNND